MFYAQVIVAVYIGAIIWNVVTDGEPVPIDSIELMLGAGIIGICTRLDKLIKNKKG